MCSRQLPDDFWSAAENPEAAGHWSGLFWAWVIPLLGGAGWRFYWAYSRISRQAVLIGPSRWILLGPRTLLTLWIQEKRQPEKPKPVGLIWKGPRG
jgi:hypothetical protein